MDRNYEAIFIITPKLSDNDVKALSEEMKSLIETNSGVKMLESVMEARKFAYPIKKETKGTYLRYEFTAPPETISKIKAAIKHREEILRCTFIKKE